MLLYLHTAGHMKSEGCSELSGPVKCRFVDCMLEGVVVDIGIIETLVLVCVASGKKKQKMFMSVGLHAVMNEGELLCEQIL